MPIIVNPIEIAAPTLVYDRLALRGSLNAKIVNGQVSEDSTFALVGQWYRKPESGVMDVCGLVNGNEKSASLLGNYPIIADIVAACLDYVGVTGDCTVQFHFNWMPVNGDLTGLANLMVTPVEGEPIQKLTGDTNALMETDEAFARSYAAVIGAIAAWAKTNGW